MKYPTQDLPAADVIVQGHGSIILLWPQHDLAKHWFEENVEVRQKWGEGIACEPRYVSDIIRGLELAGFEVA